ncbi:MAG: cation-transporting P-type ATPase [Intestinibacter sp.]
MWETLRKEEIFKLLKTDRRSGITKRQVIERRQKYGGNKLKTSQKKQCYKIYKAIQYILILASLYLQEFHIQGENDYIDSIIKLLQY